MLHPATDQNSLRRRRFGLTEVLLIAGILAFGAFTLVNDGRETFDSLLGGVEDVLGG